MPQTHTRIYAPNRIKELRKRSRLSLEALGAAMPSDLTASTVAKLENRKMALSADYLLEIAEVLGVHPSEILLEPLDGRVRMIPLISAEDRTAGEDRNEQLEYVSIPGTFEQPGLFAIKPAAGAAGALVNDGGFVVVDPNDCALVDNKWYMIAVNGESRYCRYHASPPHFEQGADGECVAIGAEPFVVLGRIVYTGQEL